MMHKERLQMQMAMLPLLFLVQLQMKPVCLLGMLCLYHKQTPPVLSRKTVTFLQTKTFRKRQWMGKARLYKPISYHTA